MNNTPKRRALIHLVILPACVVVQGLAVWAVYQLAMLGLRRSGVRVDQIEAVRKWIGLGSLCLVTVLAYFALTISKWRRGKRGLNVH